MGFSTNSKSLLINASLTFENSSEMLIIFKLLGLRQSSGPKNEIEGGSFLYRGSENWERWKRNVEGDNGNYELVCYNSKEKSFCYFKISEVD
jgi:hypothetical protein